MEWGAVGEGSGTGGLVDWERVLAGGLVAWRFERLDWLVLSGVVRCCSVSASVSSRLFRY